MRIAVNTRLLLHNKLDGIGWFSFETLKRITLAHPEHEFFFFFDRKPSPEFIFAKNVTPIILFPPTRHPVLWYIFFEFSVPRAIKKYNIDIFLSPDGWIPTNCPVPTVDVIHDLNFEHNPNFLKPSHHKYFTHFFPKYAKKANRLATVSEFSKKDICKTYNIDPQKIDVVYDGAHSNYHPYPENVKKSIQKKYTSNSPYFIFIGTILKRKNLKHLFLAFDKFKNTDTLGTKLLVVGSKKWWKGEIEDTFLSMKHQNDVVFVGHVDSELLGQMLSGAIALTYVSYFEGFGIPILEAFYAETPVITSNATSMPEVAGDAAILVDPYSTNDIANALTQISTNPQLANTLVEKGKLQREKFNWDKTANLLWQCLIKTIQQ